jgi:hypothetical protein
METKACSRCHEVKPLDQFYRKEGRPSSWCKVCTLADVKARYRRGHPPLPEWQMPTEKRCNKCGETKPMDQFHRRKKAKDGRNNICRECNIADTTTFNKRNPEYHRQQARLYRKRHPDRVADNNLSWRLGGVPWGTYDKMHVAQNGRCAICGTDKPSNRTKRFHVDHDAETGAIRGLLCSCCNTGIGQLQHSKTIMLSAIEYLERHSK